jgi:hypothetical protein
MKVTESVLAAMRQTNKLFESEVIKKGNIEELDFVYTASARILPPGAQLIEGEARSRRFGNGRLMTWPEERKAIDRGCRSRRRRGDRDWPGGPDCG